MCSLYTAHLVAQVYIVLRSWTFWPKSRVSPTDLCCATTHRRYVCPSPLCVRYKRYKYIAVSDPPLLSFTTQSLQHGTAECIEQDN